MPFELLDAKTVVREFIAVLIAWTTTNMHIVYKL